MSNALQDQLLKAGLTTEKKAKKAKHAKHKKNKQQKGAHNTLDEGKILAKKADDEKRQRDKALNLDKENIAKQKAIVAQIKQLIQMNKANLDEGDVTYNFDDNGLIKHIYVNEKLHEQISCGLFAIAKLNESYYAIPTIVANKISDRDSSYIIVLNDAKTTEKIDEEYAQYTIPDDLMW